MYVQWNAKNQTSSDFGRSTLVLELFLLKSEINLKYEVWYAESKRYVQTYISNINFVKIEVFEVAKDIFMSASLGQTLCQSHVSVQENLLRKVFTQS